MGISYRGLIFYCTPKGQMDSPMFFGSGLVGQFSVDGGASRTIDLNSTTDISISSEMEQARQFKNITLGIAPTGRSSHADVRTALDFADAAVKKTALSFYFTLEKILENMLAETLKLTDLQATIKKPPIVSPSDRMIVEIVFSNPTITHGEHYGWQNPGKMEEF